MTTGPLEQWREDAAPYLRAIAQACLTRIDGLRIGDNKRGADMALHFFLGASVGLRAAGHEKAADHVEMVCGLVLCVRGVRYVRELAEEPAADVKS